MTDKVYYKAEYDIVLQELAKNGDVKALHFFRQRLAGGCNEEQDPHLLNVKRRRYAAAAETSSERAQRCIHDYNASLSLSSMCRLIEQQAQRKCGKAQQSSACDQTRTNDSLYAFSLDYLISTLAGRFISLPTSSNTSQNRLPSDTVLQPLSNIPHPPPETIRGVRTLLREGTFSAADLV